ASASPPSLPNNTTEKADVREADLMRQLFHPRGTKWRSPVCRSAMKAWITLENTAGISPSSSEGRLPRPNRSGPPQGPVTTAPSPPVRLGNLSKPVNLPEQDENKKA